VARALAARLAPDSGVGLLVCPIRCAKTADAFVAAAAAAGLRAARTPLAGGEGAERYEGGYARFDVRWAAAAEAAAGGVAAELAARLALS
jgi:hypothetical protein